jgi:hypothetical protein
LARIRALRARYEAGDLTAIMEDPSNPRQPLKIPTVSSHGLPRLKAPETYTKRNRAEYNRWERDCEGFFTRSPANFVLEQQKVDFGLMYASETNIVCRFVNGYRNRCSFICLFTVLLGYLQACGAAFAM